MININSSLAVSYLRVFNHITSKLSVRRLSDFIEMVLACQVVAR